MCYGCGQPDICPLTSPWKLHTARITCDGKFKQPSGDPGQTPAVCQNLVKTDITDHADIFPFIINTENSQVLLIFKIEGNWAHCTKSLIANEDRKVKLQRITHNVKQNFRWLS